MAIRDNGVYVSGGELRRWGLGRLVGGFIHLQVCFFPSPQVSEQRIPTGPLRSIPVPRREPNVDTSIRLYYPELSSNRLGTHT